MDVGRVTRAVGGAAVTTARAAHLPKWLGGVMSGPRSYGGRAAATGRAEASVRDPETMSEPLLNNSLVRVTGGRFRMTIRDYYLAALVGLTLIAEGCVRAESTPRTEHPDMEIAKLTEAIRLNPRDANLYFSRGRAYYDKGEYDKAILDYTDAIRLDHKLSDAYYHRARVLAVGKGENDKAISDFSEAIRLDPKFAKAYYRRGVCWGMKGDIDKAIADCSEAIQIDANLAEAFGDRGRGYYQKGEYDKAIADFNQMLRLKPNQPFAYYSRGLAWGRKGEDGKAIKDFNVTGRVDSGHRWAR